MSAARTAGAPAGTGRRERVFDLPTKVFCALLTLPAALLCAGSLGSPGGALHVQSHTMLVLGKCLCYATLALSIDLVWGRLGLLSLGHGAFFALGGYAFGMYLMRQIGARGVYAASDLPDFMIFIGWEKLPWHWQLSHSPALSLLLAVAAPAALGLAFGWSAFRSRVSGVYFSIISQALTYALMLAFYLNALGFGGNNGFTDFKSVLGRDIRSPGVVAALFAMSALTLLGSCLLCRALAVSRLGLAMSAARDNENRTRFIGYRVENVKLFVFTFSAAMAGLAGALYVPQAGIINPSLLAPVFSVEMVVCVALGGRGSLHGAAAGAVLVGLLKSWLTGAHPVVWPIVLGALFVLVSVFLPGGLAGLVRDLAARLSPGRGENAGADAGGGSGRGDGDNDADDDADDDAGGGNGDDGDGSEKRRKEFSAAAAAASGEAPA
ncbi:MAG: urea ABC transporter permease subunit UrtC [Deltaproteobacteria bacterium]|nr:urea ABC transporter permease subunit UrtC [Deltaproteobacteria bacterium]